MYIEVADYSGTMEKEERVLVVKVQDTRIDVAVFVEQYVDGINTVIHTYEAMRVFEESSVSHLRVEDKLLRLIGVSHFSFDDIMGLDEVVDYSIIDIYSSNDNPLPWTSRLASTKDEKILFSSRYRDMNRFEQLVSIYMPFNTGNLNDCVIHLVQHDKLICNMEFNHKFNGNDFPIGPNGGAIWRDFFYHADLDVISQNENEARIKLKLRWNKDESPCEKKTDIFIESDSGYIPVRKLKTDENGECEFTVMFLGLPENHIFNVKVGTKHFSAIGKIEIRI